MCDTVMKQSDVFLRLLGREPEEKDQEIERLNKLIEEMKSQQEKLS